MPPEAKDRHPENRDKRYPATGLEIIEKGQFP